jgi:hypothetical protein
MRCRLLGRPSTRKILNQARSNNELTAPRKTGTGVASPIGEQSTVRCLRVAVPTPTTSLHVALGIFLGAALHLWMVMSLNPAELKDGCSENDEESDKTGACCRPATQVFVIDNDADRDAQQGVDR